MLAYQAGNVAAFECLYQRHKDPLFGHLYRSGATPEQAEDIAHDVWVVVIDSAPRYEVSAQFKTWLYRIAHNKLVDHWRKQSSRGQYQAELDDEELAQIPEAQADVEQLVLTQQLLEQIATLPPIQRQALLLKEQGFSLAEIASITNSGKETVKSRLRYATSQLRQQMGASYETV